MRSSRRFARAVQFTAEMARVLALPRREVTPEAADAVLDDWNECFAVAEGASLNRWQAFALEEVLECQGGYLGLPVGTGKSLLSALIPAVLFEYTPAVVICPAGLRDGLYSEWRKFHGLFRLPDQLPTILSYQELDREQNVTLLEAIKPGLLILDEGNRARRPTRAATKRIGRYVDRHEPAAVVMTGTPGRCSIKDFASHLIWTLKEGAPVPLDMAELEVWANAIDHKPRKYVGVGALSQLGGTGETRKAAARNGFRSRLIETPGVVIIDEDSCDQPLTIRQVAAPFDQKIEDVFKSFREDWTTPGGETVSDPLQQYQLEGEQGCGYWTEWDPPPPAEWLEARRGWHEFSSRKIKFSAHTDRPLDTPGAVARAYPKAPELLAWREVKDTFIPNSVPRWFSGSVVHAAAQWIKRNGPACVWSWSVPFAEALATSTGLPYFRQKGLDGQGRFVEHAPQGSSAIVSGMANLEGRNLQYLWHRALWVVPPTSSLWIEQALGRHHRQGQEHPVEVDILVTSGGVADALESAIAESEAGRETWIVEQKLLRARIERLTVLGDGLRWARKTDEGD